MANPALTYEEAAVPTLFGPWAEFVVRAAQPRPGERVLDAACGTGIVARLAAPLVGDEGGVVGVDMNPAMLDVARAVSEREALDITWREARLEELPFPDGSFDVVTCQHGLQFVEQRERALGELTRVLANGGRIAISVWRSLEHHPFYAAVNEMLERHIGIPALTGPFSFGDADELYASLANAGLSDIAIEVRTVEPREERAHFAATLMDVIAAAIPAAQHLDDHARDVGTGAIARELDTLMEPWLQGDDVVVPFHGHIAIASRRVN
jgi:ubiquinone/menaquinone biosynthesis C-methylase UbiE